MGTQEALLSMPALRVWGVLTELFAIRQRARAGERVDVPLVTLHLRNGRDVQGWVVSLSSEVHVGALLLHVPGPDLRHPNQDALYVDVESVEAVTVHDAAGVAPLISGGRAPVSPPPPPTRPELERRAQALEGVLAARLGHPFSIDVAWDAVPPGDAMRGLAAALEDAATALDQVARDEQGRKSLAGVRVLRFIAGPESAVRLEGEALVCTVLPEGSGQATLAGAELRVAIEAIL